MSPESVAALLSRRAPSLTFRAVEALGEGDFFRAYSLDGVRVVRVAKHAGAAAALRREACLLPRLASRLPLPVPRPTLASGGEDDPAFAIHPLLPGPPLTRERYLGLPEPLRDRCARQVGEFLSSLHRADLAEARACGVPDAGYRERCSALLEEARSGLLPRLTPAESAYAERVLAEYLESDAAAAFRPVLLHGDLGPDHVLYDERAGRVSGIIDFGDMTIGDPAWDLVYVYEDYGLDFLGRLLEAFAPGDRHGLLGRMHRFLEIDAIRWAAAAHAAGDRPALADAVEYLGVLRAQAQSPPWRTLVRPSSGHG